MKASSSSLSTAVAATTQTTVDANILMALKRTAQSAAHEPVSVPVVGHSIVSPMPAAAATATSSSRLMVMPSSAISNSNSPAGSTTTSPRLAPAPVLTSVGLGAGLGADENVLAGRYAGIIRAQALVRSMYELEQMRARNELLRAVYTTANATNCIGGISKPTAVKAMTGQFPSKVKFRHYGNQQKTTPRGYVVPTMTNKQQQQQQQRMQQPQKLKPLEPPPMLWKPTRMVQLKNNMKTEKTFANSVSPVTVVAPPPPPTSK
eukprot:CAMPEP_0113467730 /NCGR_PEP_ID=MMETSP0014_2-20120614/14972_1 /TAXON_ID=2857 /ORGANISM="Nitzschia sp." /LENGTH=261 /DNA_ID=CAMNT_0000360061 /DNA_START=262 /DNA_END=1047 /DNA_ORIENTATION=- /assembly_acc=CAM_ASM_000159